MRNPDLTDVEIESALPVMRKLVWADREQRGKLQELGLNVTPVNFYSNIPSISEVMSSYEYTDASIPYLNETIFNKEALREELSRLIPFSEDFTPPENGNEENCDRFFWKNSQFTYSDAMSYYAYIRRIKPKTVVEIGSGFSSLAALEALGKNGVGKLKCIEPFPRPFITKLGSSGTIDLHKTPAQGITPETLNSMLADGDILFIDSTHTVKSGSDCLHIYLRLLPHINKKIFVHVHDFFLPFGIPKDWLLDLHIYWTEQYLLLAWMLDNPRVSVLFGSAYHQHFNADLLDSFMRGRNISGGSSFWLEYDGRRG
ncbi:MAG: class I SAM-dependent methyltransferase [Nitrospinae bacterium]|nr:class I SAM-dependent methyltransferase [Nitrospinota bacterium]